jgi:N-acetylneuraminic acid mutarotase
MTSVRWAMAAVVLGVCGCGSTPNPLPDSGNQTGTDGGNKTDAGQGVTDAGGADAGPGPGCEIGGLGYTAGQANPQNACQLCAPAASTTAWTIAADGTACGVDVEVCTGGVCQCPGTEELCQNQCSNPATDNFNCGSCGNTCTGNLSCFDAACEMVPLPMPTPRSALVVVATADGRICAIGGWDGTSQTYATVEIYSPASDTWSTGASMPTSRDDMAAARGTDGRIYVFGGQAGNLGAPLATLEIYDPSSNLWTTGAPLTTARNSPAAAAGTDGRIYALGGDDANLGDPPYASVEAYTPSSNTWAAVAPMPTARTRLAAATGADGSIYALGGNIGGDATTAAEIYNPTANTWTAGPALLQKAQYLAAAVLSGHVYAMGGSDPLTFLTAVESYDPVAAAWSLAPVLVTARDDLGAAVGSDGRIYAVGGYNGVGPVPTVEAYLPGDPVGWVP